MKIKKVIAVIAGIAVALSAAVGGVYGYKSYQDKKLVAEVQPVSSLNWGYWGDTETSYGTVTNDSSQEIYLDDSRMIKEVYVEKGDEVQKGDPLLAYDTAELQIEIERKKLDISTIENNIERQKYKYEMLKTQTPVKKDPPKLNEEQLAWYQHMDEENRLTETDKNDGRIYNYLTAASIPYNVTTNAAGELVYPAGTAEEPYIYYVNQNAYAYGGFFNAIRPTAEGGSGKHVRVIVCKKDADGKMVLDTDEATGRQTPVADDTVSPNTVELNGSDFPADYDESRMWYLFSGKEYIPTSLADEYMQAYEDFMADWEVPKGYTSEELYQEAADIEEKLKTLDIQRRQEQLALESMEKSATDGVVYAEVDGVVKTVGDPDEKPEQGQAFLVVTGDDGLYVKGPEQSVPLLLPQEEAADQRRRKQQQMDETGTSAGKFYKFPPQSQYIAHSFTPTSGNILKRSHTEPLPARWQASFSSSCNSKNPARHRRQAEPAPSRYQFQKACMCPHPPHREAESSASTPLSS